MKASKGATLAKRLKKLGRDLSKSLSEIDFSDAVPWVYNPLEYAWDPYAEYLDRFSSSPLDCLYLGMNPGPWGMAQTGIPFGEVAAVREWLKIESSAKKPAREHPKRPIEGLACTKSEVSGRRLWSLFRDRYGTPEEFFRGNLVANYCPLAFMNDSAANVTPDKLPAKHRASIQAACDEHLRSWILLLEPKWVIGIGGYAEEAARRVTSGMESIQVGKILHPSPASPAANRGWEPIATKQLIELGIWT